MTSKPIATKIRRVSVLVAAAALATTVVAPSGAQGGTTIGAPLRTVATDSAAPSPAAPSADPLLTSTDYSVQRAAAGDFAAARAAAEPDGTTRVIVGLRESFAPEGVMSRNAVASQRSRIAAAAAEVAGVAEANGGEVTRRYRTVPFVAMRANKATLQALEAAGIAASVTVDTPQRVHLSDSDIIVESYLTRAVGLRGDRKVVAVLDTGVDRNHGFLGGRVVEEACYAANGTCPNGQASMTGAGAGMPCTFTDCSHGTHVAGIAAGGAPPPFTSPYGVASNADIMAVQVFTRFTGTNCGGGPSPCALTLPSDQIAGLERVYSRRTTRSIASVNMSLGGGQFTSNCNTNPLKPIIDNLRAAGIATIISSGNNGFTNAVSGPSCIGSAITVGSTTKTDGVSSFSNSSPLVELLAPGSDIISSVPGGFFDEKSGTSMAAPQVAGAWAVIKQAHPGASVQTVLDWLQTGGVSITDFRNGVVKKRIRLGTAMVVSPGTGMRYQQAFGPLPGLGVVSQGKGFSARHGAPASAGITISGVPTGAVKVKAYLFWNTLGTDSQVSFNGQNVTGTWRGFSNGCTPTHFASSFFRADVTSRIPAAINGTYTVTGFNRTAPNDANGASLVIVYQKAGQPNGRAVIRDGALTADQANETLSTTFTGLGVGATTTRRLHVGMGDGTAAHNESALKVRGIAQGIVNPVRASDGGAWDDLTQAVSAAALPAGTASAPVSITTAATTPDCFTWQYAALEYR